MLFFISLERRRIEFIACTANPTGAWVAQQARNVLMTLDDRGQPFRFLIHDRDAKFSGGCDHVFQTEGIAVIRTPVQAPNANAHAQRWVRTLRADCLDRVLILGRRHLEHVLRVYRSHYNETGHTARSTFSRRTAATQRSQARLLPLSTVATDSADSSMNTRPPEFANPTG